MKKFLVTRCGKILSSELRIRKIPKKPSIKLPNYLNKLYDREVDEKTNPILIITKENLKVSTKELDNYPKKRLDSLFNNPKYFVVLGSKHKIELPNLLDPKLFYLVGYLYGDGDGIVNKRYLYI